MKLLKYQLMTEVNHGTEDAPQLEQIFSAVEMQTTEANSAANLAIAQAEAYNGEVEVVEVEEPETEPTEAEQLRADVDFIAAMTGVTL